MVIAMTANGTNGNMKRLYDDGAHFVIEKPFNIVLLKTVLKQALKESPGKG